MVVSSYKGKCLGVKQLLILLSFEILVTSDAIFTIFSPNQFSFVFFLKASYIFDDIFIPTALNAN